MAAQRQIDEEGLLDAALREFSSRSYKEASVNTIIADAGISKGSFYYRFATKFDLYLHVLKSGIRLKWEYIRANMPVATQAPADIFDQFMVQAKIGMEFARANPGFQRLSLMFSREKGSTHYETAIAELGGGTEDGLDAALQAAVEKGEIRGEFSPEFLSKVVSHLLVAFDQIFFSDGERTPEAAYERLEEYVRFLRHGLAPISPRHPAGSGSGTADRLDPA